MEKPLRLKQAKTILIAVLSLISLLSYMFVRSDSLPGLYYVVHGFLITEWSVVGSALVFDAMAAHWYPYKIRKGQATSQSLVERSIWERLSKYKTDWILYTLTWVFSRMSFEKDYPGAVKSALQVAFFCIVLDAHIYLSHFWMHTRQGQFCHRKHHSFRYVSCWFVDHETRLESAIIAVGKHGTLVFFSPHPQTALEYLLVTKLWNVVAHCGYNLPPFQFVDKYLPFVGTPNRHEQHHFHGVANLSIFTTIFDYLGSTLIRTDEQGCEWREANTNSSSVAQWEFG